MSRHLAVDGVIVGSVARRSLRKRSSFQTKRRDMSPCGLGENHIRELDCTMGVTRSTCLVLECAS